LINLEEMIAQVSDDMPQFAMTMCADASDDPYPIPMVKLASLLLVYHMHKDSQYGRSWAKRGEAGVYHNVMRKSDRYGQLADRLEKLDGIAKVVMSGHRLATDEIHLAFVDLLVDISLYCLMWLDWIAAERPEDVERWVEEVWSNVTGIDVAEIMEFLR